MKIKEFANLYGFDTREIDYWTSIGLLHPAIKENGYRDYNDECAKEIELIIIAEVLDWPGPLKQRVERLKQCDSKQWKKLIVNLNKRHDQYNIRYNAAYNSAVKRSDY